MKKHEDVCPVWAGYLLANPLRKLIQNPPKIVSPYIKSGSKILEIGPGMGFFSLPMARMAGDTGRVYCIDIQEGMLKKLRRRAQKRGLTNIETRLADPASFQIDDLTGQIDFVLLFAVVHEVPDQTILFKEVSGALKPGGVLLFAEPQGHVRQDDVERSVSVAETFELKNVGVLDIKRSHSILFRKP